MRCALLFPNLLIFSCQCFFVLLCVVRCWLVVCRVVVRVLVLLVVRCVLCGCLWFVGCALLFVSCW